MFKEKHAMFMTALTPMHAGSGTGLSVVDLPIQRERHTYFPNIAASTLKGCVRNAVESGSIEKGENTSDDFCSQFFGSEGDASLSAAAAVFTDARLLFFPVRSVKGVFALITCPMVLRRFADDMKRIDSGIKLPLFDDIPAIPAQSEICFLNKLSGKEAVMLDEFLYSVQKEQQEGKLSAFLGRIQGFLPERQADSHGLCAKAIVLPDDDFTDFVRHSTEIETRIAIGQDGVVKDGALFTEEYLPTESILYSIVMAGDAKTQSGRETAQKTGEELMRMFKKRLPDIFQIGADLTLGKGFVGCKLVKGSAGGEGNA